MKLTLHTLQGEELFECNVDVSSSQDWSLMADNKLSITFQLEHCVNLSPGSYVDYDGVRFYLLKEFKPTEIDSATWSYSLTLFDAASWMSVTVPVNLLDGKNNPTFVYTASLREHAAIIVANLNRRMNTDQWKVGNIIDSSNITVKYDGRYCSAILQELVDDQNTEWWVDGMTLNIGRAEFGELIELGYGNGLLGNIVCDQADNMRSYAYLYPLGSTRNIDPTKYGYERLQLPNGQMYVDMSETGIAELVEERAFAGIFPRYEGAVTSVRSRAATSDNGEEFIIYYISDSDIPFNPNNYKMPGLVPNITFLSGELMGQDFEVNYDADAHEFEIITRWTTDNVTQLPGGLLTPAVGDEYVVWNITMPDEYYPKAEQEFLEAAQKYADKAEKDISIYKANLDYIEGQERGLQLRPGQKVRLISSEYFPDKGYYDSRITRITRKLWYPDEVAIDVSAVRVIGSLSRIESSLSKAETRVSQLSVSIPAIIKSTDNSLPTDSSVYTSLRVDKEYLSRRKGGVMEGPLYIGNALASASWTGSKGMFFGPLQDGLFRGDIDEFHTKELFTETFSIAGIPFRKMANGSLFIDANVVFGGGVTMYGTDSTPAPSIFDGLPIDNETIYWDNGVLKAMGGGGGGGVADSVAWANVVGKPTWITNTKPTYNYSEILNTPDLSVYALASAIPTNNNQLTNGAGYITAEDTVANANKLGGYLPTTYMRASGQYTDSLNDLTSLGIYRMADTITDGPSGAGGYGNLMVIRSNGWDTLSQLYFNANNRRIFVRSGNNSNLTSKSWETLAFTSDIPSLNDYATETFVNTAVNGVKEWVEEQQYLTEITSGMIESVLGYQPYDGDTNRLGFLTSSALTPYFLTSNFTKANIKTTLGISDWALASSLEWRAINSKPTNIDGFGMVEYLTNLNNATLNKFFRSSFQASNRPAYNYAVGFTLGNGSISANYAAQLAIDYYGGVHTRYKASTEWSEWVELAPLSSVPTKLSQLTDDVVAGKYLPLSGGTINGNLNIGSADNNNYYYLKFSRYNHALRINNTDAGGNISFGDNTNGSFTVEKTLEIGDKGFRYSSDGGNTYKDILHSGNYSNYALPKDGTAASATKLATPRTIWGKSFDGTGNVTGDMSGVWKFSANDNGYLTDIANGDIAISLPVRVTGGWARGFTYKHLSNEAAFGNLAGVFGEGTTLYYYFYGGNYGTGSHAMRLYDASQNYKAVFNGNVAIGGTTANAKLHVYGNLLTEGGITMFSQRSLKNILSYEGLSLEQLAVIKPIKFTWKDGRDNRYHVGGVADDMATVVPEVVYSANDFLTMDYGNAGFYVAASLIKPVIDHETRIKQLECRVKELEQENKQLRQSA